MKVKILVIGVGNMGSSHARAYHAWSGFELVGLVARHDTRKDTLSKEMGGVSVYADYKQAIEETSPDAISINTYPETHEEIALYGLNAGLHVFLEKPMATSVEGALRIKHTAEKKNLKVVVGYILRHHPSWIKFTKLAQGLGSPLVLRMNLNQQSYGELWQTHKNLMKSMSPIVDCGVHYVDIMCQMTQSKPVQVYATGSRLTPEISEDMYNYGMLQVTFEDGSIGWYEAGWGPMMSTTAYFVKDVIGPGGSVSIVEPQHEGGDIENHVKTSRMLLHHTDPAKEDQWIDVSEEPDHQELCELEQKYFYKAIHEDIDLAKHLDDAVNSLKIVLAADQSIRANRIVTL
ncbi:Gfo/Idh/MocA family protein [Portibacter marinus]|uniref:Gfo/Idh/MocA family protein n=1 Tax=Portibacter marinus TaxID=2898660 RepID=UPI001F25C3CE|nr:Gfo/Idh/MocA family oxidoreductase [Portibacter marinus]